VTDRDGDRSVTVMKISIGILTVEIYDSYTLCSSHTLTCSSVHVFIRQCQRSNGNNTLQLRKTHFGMWRHSIHCLHTTKLQISRLIYYTSARIRDVIYTPQLVLASLRAAIVQSSKVSDSYKGNVNVGIGS